MDTDNTIPRPTVTTGHCLSLLEQVPAVPAATDPLAAIQAAWRAEVAAPGFRILAATPARPDDTGRRGCELWHDPVPDGRDGRGMTRLVCRACGRFYGYSHDEQATTPGPRRPR